MYIYILQYIVVCITKYHGYNGPAISSAVAAAAVVVLEMLSLAMLGIFDSAPPPKKNTDQKYQTISNSIKP